MPDDMQVNLLDGNSLKTHNITSDSISIVVDLYEILDAMAEKKLENFLVKVSKIC
ncbi:MAG: hypothetical protein KJ630_20150 [Proteobacteria bacterium]|nr:hypothetical protein [Pseudomonadota bacterium]